MRLHGDLLKLLREDASLTVRWLVQDIDTLAARVEDLKKQLSWHESGYIHTCHAECKKPMCVLHRKVRHQAEMLERAEQVIQEAGIHIERPGGGGFPRGYEWLKAYDLMKSQATRS